MKGCGLVIFRSKGQRSRSQCIDYWKWFLVHNCFPFIFAFIKLYTQIPSESRICPNDIGIKSSDCDFILKLAVLDFVAAEFIYVLILVKACCFCLHSSSIWLVCQFMIIQVVQYLEFRGWYTYVINQTWIVCTSLSKGYSHFTKTTLNWTLGYGAGQNIVLGIWNPLALV